MMCSFVTTSENTHRCSVCGQVIVSSDPADRIYAECSVGGAIVSPVIESEALEALVEEKQKKPCCGNKHGKLR